MENKYKILKHPADLKIKVWAKDLKKLFSLALFALFKTINAKTEGNFVFRKIKVKSNDLPSLFVDFLNETLCLSQIKKEVFFDLKIKKSSFEKDFFIEGLLKGKKIKSIDLDIKAVTYHQLKIEKKKGKWVAVFLCDI